MTEGTREAGRQRVEWDEGAGAWVKSTEELDLLLNDLAEAGIHKPLMVESISAKGDSLSIGVGSQESILSWIPAGGNPPYFASKGNPDAQGTVVFFYRGSWSEFPRWSAIPVATAREAMRQFLETGERPTNVNWEEV